RPRRQRVRAFDGQGRGGDHLARGVGAGARREEADRAEGQRAVPQEDASRARPADRHGRHQRARLRGLFGPRRCHQPRRLHRRGEDPRRARGDRPAGRLADHALAGREVRSEDPPERARERDPGADPGRQVRGGLPVRPRRRRGALAASGLGQVSAALVAQALVSGLLIGFVFALIAAGLTLIFGVMEIVNFAHGEFLMLSMYLSYFLHAGLGWDPIAALPVNAVALFALGVLVYYALIRRVLRAPMLAQIFATFGLG